MHATTSNPFNSEHLRPGVIDYIFPAGDSVDALIARWQTHRWRGEIIGPHGSGKSTLVQMLLPRLQTLGFHVTLGTFQGGQQRWSEFPVASNRRVVVIDGFEQLSALVRFRWRFMTWLRGQGLIVTAHRPMGLPVLYRAKVTLKVARRIVAKLVDGRDLDCSPTAIARALQSHRGNMRDTLFALYDAYEAKQ